MKAILKIKDKEIEVEVSEEQIEKLTKKKSPFARVTDQIYYYITSSGGSICSLKDVNSSQKNSFYDIANYCTDKNLIQQQAWRETLNRLLWRWQYENDEPVAWGNKADKFSIYYSYESECFKIDYAVWCKDQRSVYFSNYDKAKQAIEEVVKPFMAEHPDFVW